MKAVVLSFIFLAVIILGGIVSTVYISNVSKDLVKDLQSLEKHIEAENWEQSREMYKDFKNKWHKVDHKWSVLIDHNEIDYITMDLGELEAYLKTKDKSNALAKLCSLKLLVKHIPDKEFPSIKNIL